MLYKSGNIMVTNTSCVYVTIILPHRIETLYQNDRNESVFVKSGPSDQVKILDISTKIQLINTSK